MNHVNVWEDTIVICPNGKEVAIPAGTWNVPDGMSNALVDAGKAEVMVVGTSADEPGDWGTYRIKESGRGP